MDERKQLFEHKRISGNRARGKKMSLLIKNAKIFLNGKLIQKNLFLEGGKISGITSKEMLAEETIDAKGKIILPGAIDCHVHFREPGMTHKGDWSTESRAAACGGITTVIEMPNTIPATSTIEALKEKKEIAGKKAYCNYGIHFGAEKENLSEIEKAQGIASIKVFMGASTGNLLIKDTATLEKVFLKAKEKNKIVTLHAEEEQIIKENAEKAKEKGWNSVKYHNKIRSSEAEVKAIKKALEIQQKIGNKMHFCHVSTAAGIKEIEKAKKEGKGKISCEVSPHHLFLYEGNLRQLKNYGKMNPPLREKKDCSAL
ncbi:MAG: amidohydrolase family protein [Candidatus Diapherotrites archaeon]